MIDKAVDQVTVLACVPYVVSLVTNATFTLPDLRIDANR
jgi:hypothetical protein